MRSLDEIGMQAVLMRWAMNTLNHIFVVPNSTVIFPWESDLISATRALYTHEYEIKISMGDYRKDAKKTGKHHALQTGVLWENHPKWRYCGPNYFWYATTFDIEPPTHAGWVKVTWDEKRKYNRVDVMKPAPRLSTQKLNLKQQVSVAKLLSFRVTNYYGRYLDRPTEIEAACIAAQGVMV